MKLSIGDRVRSLRPDSAADGVEVIGHVIAVRETTIRARVPELRVGDTCRIAGSGSTPVDAEAIGFDEEGMILMPLAPVCGLAPGARVSPLGTSVTVPAGSAVRGRVLDALGAPRDGRGPLSEPRMVPLMAAPPDPIRRRKIDCPLSVGVPSIDALLTIGRGQRVGVMAGAGVGKSTLLGMIARHVEADFVVAALIGERGREVEPFVEEIMGRHGSDRATVVVSTSDESPLRRLKAAYTATAIAEAARAEGQDVVLLMDSVTRFARALREVGLAAGEPPGRQGFPASVFALLPRLFERAGNDDRGTMTAFYTVLVTGDDLTEPVADETMSLLDGHIILSRELADRGRYPAIDVLGSRSRVMESIVDSQQRASAQLIREALGLYERNYDKIQLRRFEPRGRDAELARLFDPINRFLASGNHARPMAESVAEIGAIVESVSERS